MQKQPPNQPPQQICQFVTGAVKISGPPLAVGASPQTGLQAPAVLRSPGFGAAASPSPAVQLQSPVRCVPARSTRISLSKSQQALGAPAAYRPAQLSNVARPVTALGAVRGRSDGLMR